MVITVTVEHGIEDLEPALDRLIAARRHDYKIPSAGHRPLRPRRPSMPKFDVPDDIDPRAIRQSLRCTQERFAGLLGVSVRTIQAWKRVSLGATSAR